MKLSHLVQRFKCMIGWHRPGVYGHVINHQIEVEDILEMDPSLQIKYNPKYEYYMCCIACEEVLTWDYQYNLPHFKKYARYIPMELESKKEVFEE